MSYGRITYPTRRAAHPHQIIRLDIVRTTDENARVAEADRHAR
jgi:hypothetical protein